MKEDFEQNLLDGDKVEASGGAMISAEEAYKYFSDYLLTIRKKIEEKRQFVGENGKTYYDEVEKIGYNTAIRDILSLSELQVREQ